MKKGFTLPEVLAVIVILGVILAIAVPYFNNVAKNSRLKLFQSINQTVVKSAREYLTENIHKLPKEGDTAEVTVNDLISSGYIKGIKNPMNKEETCTGYVLIRAIENDEFSYNPYINCGGNINNRVEDGLILHYTFDDFQEPTTNKLTISNQQFTDGWPGINGSNLNWSYNQRVDEWNTKNAVRVQTTGGTSYLKIVHQVACPGVLNVKYASQIKVKNVGNKKAIIRNQYGNRTDINPGEVITVQQSAVGNGSGCYQIRIETENISDNLDLYLYQPQAENKLYSTPFVVSSREGIIKDYSGNNRDATLTESNTPRWTEEGYLFDGVDDYVYSSNDINDLIRPGNFTVSAWIKNESMDTNMQVEGIISLSFGLNMDLTGSGNIRITMDNGTDLVQYKTSGINLYDNKYHMVSMTYDKTTLRVYVDGVQVGNALRNFNNRYNNVPVIGYNPNNPPLTRYSGLIDDVRIYSRTLSDNEILQIYNSTNTH